MKIALIYFTFGKDEQLLLQSLRCVERLRKVCPQYIIDVHLIIDGNCPLSSVPPKCFSQVTTSNRCGNLTSLDWIKEEMNIIANISKEGSYDWVMKVDSDTIITSLDFLNGCEGYDAIGAIRSFNYNTMFGQCMPFSAGGASKLPFDKKRSLFYQLYKDKYGFFDDQYINCLCHKGVLNVKKNLITTWCYDDNYSCEDIAQYHCCDFKEVTYKYGTKRQEEFRENAIKRMKNYADYICSKLQ